MPLVEVAHHHAGPGHRGGVAHEAGQQIDLLAAFPHGEPEMAVKDVQRTALDVEIDAQARARLARAVAEVAGTPAEYGQTAQDGVAVGAIPMRTHDAHDERHAEPIREERRLVVVRSAAL